jgi:hypothetical protein
MKIVTAVKAGSKKNLNDLAIITLLSEFVVNVFSDRAVVVFTGIFPLRSDLAARVASG